MLVVGCWHVGGVLHILHKCTRLVWSRLPCKVELKRQSSGGEAWACFRGCGDRRALSPLERRGVKLICIRGDDEENWVCGC